MVRRSPFAETLTVAALGVATILLVLALGSKPLMDFVVRLSIYGLFAMSLNVLVGYTGLVSFGHAMFFGFGAYAFGLLMQSGAASIPLAFVATLAGTVVLAGFIGGLCIRLTAIYFAFLTLAFQMLIYAVILSWVSLTGGDQGLQGGIPRPRFLGINLADPGQSFVITVVLFFGSILLLRQLLESPFGYSLRMIRDNAARASAIGLNVQRYKLASFVIAALFAALAGILMSLYVSGAYPNFAFWTLSGEGIFMIMLGGMTVFAGPIVGTAIFLLL
ncbi:MAG TPA: branched-chain amino acid ABC transporter permease, partial [Stellaceae bacterium]|nr:branched-chain amino acid ABC transporter permease [Stellaceae bacterium]